MDAKARAAESAALFDDDFYTIRDLMKRLGQTREWIMDNLVKPGAVPYRKVGAVYFFHKDHLGEWAKGDDRP